MLRPRISPCLLIQNKGLVKTVKFKDPKYVGDPLNAVKIFNEKEVDELIVLDIDATAQNKEPNFEMIKNLAVECRMAFCYGGGVKTVEHAIKIISLGAEKVALSAAALANPSIISDISKAVGCQSVVVILDVKKKFLGGYEVYTHNGKKNTGLNPVDLAKKFQDLGAGEIVINSIDNDGVMKGYDFPLIDKIREAITLPMTVLGGAGTMDDIAKVINKYGIIGISAGSLFVFKGVYKAVLISYPNPAEKDKLIAENFIINP
jgi:imidazole glycerol-phosphate synthase subunit HisF